MSMNKLIGIAGGSGSGKSTLAVALCKNHPHECALVHTDDYFKKTEDVPRLEGFTNWDHPGAIRFDDLYADISHLLAGEPITIRTKSELYNPGYRRELKNRIEYTVQPKPVVILEGYLALYDARIKNLMNFKVYLDIPIHLSTKRRSENKFSLDKLYFEKVLLPMYKKFVEPTKKYADLIIDVSDKNKEEVLQIIESKLFR